MAAPSIAGVDVAEHAAGAVLQALALHAADVLQRGRRPEDLGRRAVARGSATAHGADGAAVVQPVARVVPHAAV